MFPGHYRLQGYHTPITAAGDIKLQTNQHISLLNGNPGPYFLQTWNIVQYSYSFVPIQLQKEQKMEIVFSFLGKIKETSRLEMFVVSGRALR